MAANVGLSTPRGSGTSGYVQRNLSHMKPRDNYAPYPKDYEQMKHRQRKPDKDILDHDRLRDIEVKVFDLRDKLEDEEVDEDEIEIQTSALRKKLTEGGDSTLKSNHKGQYKPHQVHELAEAKIEESEKLRKALGISKDYEEGSHWKRQEERLRESAGDREKEP
ncbi:hypothetical protein P7C71_g2081, partial [Lecanoromycetidae sp. Uapishka_2]